MGFKLFKELFSNQFNVFHYFDLNPGASCEIDRLVTLYDRCNKLFLCFGVPRWDLSEIVFYRWLLDYRFIWVCLMENAQRLELLWKWRGQWGGDIQEQLVTERFVKTMFYHIVTFLQRVSDWFHTSKTMDYFIHRFPCREKRQWLVR